MFETLADFDPSEIQRLHKFVATGVALMICTLYAEAKDSATWPKVNFLVLFWQNFAQVSGLVLSLTEKVQGSGF